MRTVTQKQAITKIIKRWQMIASSENLSDTPNLQYMNLAYKYSLEHLGLTLNEIIAARSLDDLALDGYIESLFLKQQQS